MDSLREGNLYNVETEISHTQNPSVEGLQQWKNEVRRHLLDNLRRSNIQNIDEIINSIFGKTLD